MNTLKNCCFAILLCVTTQATLQAGDDSKSKEGLVTNKILSDPLMQVTSASLYRTALYKKHHIGNIGAAKMKALAKKYQHKARQSSKSPQDRVPGVTPGQAKESRTEVIMPQDHNVLALVPVAPNNKKMSVGKQRNNKNHLQPKAHMNQPRQSSGYRAAGSHNY